MSREYPPSIEGGISRRLERLVPRLLDRGIEIGVVCFGGSSIAGETIYSLDVASKIFYTRAGEPSAGDFASILNDIRRLDSHASEISNRNGYDLLQIEEPVFGPFIQTGLPTIVTVHNTQIGESKTLLGILTEARQAKRLLFSGTVGTFFDFLCFRKTAKS